MKIISTSNGKNFNIQRNDGHSFLELKYKNWFSSTATAHFNDKEIQIKPKNIWGTSFDIFHNGIDVGDISFNWLSNAVISINEQKYLFKAIGLWNLKFELINEEEKRIALIKPSLKWMKLKYDYEIELIENDENTDQFIELLAYVGFAANLHMTATMRQ